MPQHLRHLGVQARGVGGALLDLRGCSEGRVWGVAGEWAQCNRSSTLLGVEVVGSAGAAGLPAAALEGRRAAQPPTCPNASTMMASRKLRSTRKTRTSKVQKKAAPATPAGAARWAHLGMGQGSAAPPAAEWASPPSGAPATPTASPPCSPLSACRSAFTAVSPSSSAKQVLTEPPKVEKPAVWVVWGAGGGCSAANAAVWGGLREHPGTPGRATPPLPAAAPSARAPATEEPKMRCASIA